MREYLTALRDKGLRTSTVHKYDDIVGRVEEGESLIAWIEQQVKRNTPLGTVLPLRAAVSHYLQMEGYSKEELKELLPAASGKAAVTRRALDPDQLALYHAAIREIASPQVRTILAILPSTGLRIGEATRLRASNVIEKDGFSLHMPTRDIPLSETAVRHFSRYLQEIDPTDWLFPSPTMFSQPITQHAVRKYTRAIAARTPELCDLTPTQLRATAAVLWTAAGMSLDVVQHLLGHEQEKTTIRLLT